MSTPPYGVSLDLVRDILVVEHLTVSDQDVVREATRWASGERGPSDPEAAAESDLSAFAYEALTVGARVIAIASQSSDTLAVQQAVKTASDQVTDAVKRVSTSTDETLRRAADTIASTAREAHEQVLAQVNRLVGGENPELMDRLRPVLAKVGSDLESQIARGINSAQSEAHIETERRHAELKGLIREVHRDLVVKAAEETAADQAAREAIARTSTTVKGFDFEEALHVVLHRVAANLGDEYQETGALAGRLSRNKKGDGVLVVEGGLARVVFEAHDGTSKEWSTYLAEAERNRGASCSIGVVRRAADNGGSTIRVIGPKRVVIAFDPAGTGDPKTDAAAEELLRTTVLLMRAVALTSSGNFGAAEVAVASDHIREALAAVADLEDAKKAASAINSNATRIEQVATRVMTSIQRELNGAINALVGAGTEPLAGRAEEERPDGCLGEDDLDDDAPPVPSLEAV